MYSRTVSLQHSNILYEYIWFWNTCYRTGSELSLHNWYTLQRRAVDHTESSNCNRRANPQRSILFHVHNNTKHRLSFPQKPRLDTASVREIDPDYLACLNSEDKINQARRNDLFTTSDYPRVSVPQLMFSDAWEKIQVQIGSQAADQV